MDDEQRRNQYQQPTQDGQPEQPVGPPPNETQYTATPTPAEPKRSNKKTIAIVVILVVSLLIMAGAVWAYMMANSPQNTLKKAVANLVEQDAVAADFRFVTKEGDVEDVLSGDFSFKRDSDNEKNFELSGGITEGDARFGTDFRNVDETYYIRVNGLDSLAAFAPEGETATEISPVTQAYFEAFSDQWFSFTHESVEQLLAENSGYNADAELSEEDIRTIEAIYDEHQFVIIEEQDDATIDDVSTRHFVMRVDQGTFIAFLEVLQDANIESLEIKDELIQSLQEKEAKENYEKLRIEAWITDDDEFKQLQFYEADAPEETITLTFRDVEAENVEVVAPENAQDLTQLFQTFLGGGMGSPSPMPQNSEITGPAMLR